MGNTGGNSCFVQLPQICFSPGDCVSGTLHVCINTPVMVTEIQLKITGCERTHWRERRHRTETREINGETRQERIEYFVDHYGRNDFFKMRIPLHRPGQMFTGQYSFPFTFQFPQGIPGSFSMQGRHFDTHFDCSCVYKVKGLCQVQGFLKSNIKHTQYLQIIERPPPIVGQAADDLVQVNVCCCFNRGQFYISMRSDKNSYCTNAGEVVQVIADMDNQTSKDIGSTHVELWQHLVLRTSSGLPFRHAHVVARSTFPGLLAGESHRGENARHMPLPLSCGLMPQCLGRLIQCGYYLRISASVACANDPDVKVPICMYAPQPEPQAWQAPPTPAGWAPQVMPGVDIGVPQVMPSNAADQDEFYRLFQPSAPPLAMQGREVVGPRPAVVQAVSPGLVNYASAMPQPVANGGLPVTQQPTSGLRGQQARSDVPLLQQ